MVTEITNGIKIVVETEYQSAYSSPSQYHYVFTYQITIENNSEKSVQLLRRQWQIYDAGFAKKEIKGEGVIGQQPMLVPGQSHQYISGCMLKSGIGKMVGTYQMQQLDDSSLFIVNIPTFSLVAPMRLN